MDLVRCELAGEKVRLRTEEVRSVVEGEASDGPFGNLAGASCSAASSSCVPTCMVLVGRLHVRRTVLFFVW